MGALRGSSGSHGSYVDLSKFDVQEKHVLENLSPEELKELETSNYTPDKFNQWKSAAELLARHVCDMKERKMVTGSSHDVVSAFKHRWQLDAASEKTIRALNHKDLRYVLSNYDGTAPLEDVIGEVDIELDAQTDFSELRADALKP